MHTDKIISEMEIPVGLMKSPINRSMTIENVELRAALDKAVEDANLNVTERMALNKMFYPNGGGFELFPKNVQVPVFNMFHKPGQVFQDSFTKEVDSIKIPEYVSRVNERTLRSSKGNFKANFDNAIKKLKKVLK